MNLTPEEQEDLIEFLAKNLPTFPLRKAIATECGLEDLPIGGDPSRGWSLLVRESLKRGQVRQLLLAAARQTPGDPTMEAMAEGLKHGKLLISVEEPGQGMMQQALTMGIGVAVLVVLGVLGLMFGPSLLADMGEPEEGSELPEGERPEVEVRQGLMTDGDKPPATTPKDPGTEAATAPEDAPPADAPATPGGDKYIVIKDPTEGGDNAAAGCDGPKGTVIGYALGGATQPSAAGGAWAVPGDIKVRVAYPTPENGYNSDARVVCTLTAGGTAPVGEPFTVDDGSWWVPITGSE